MEDDSETPPAPAKPSQVPSWVTLGFVLGALFVWALPKREPEVPLSPPPPPSLHAAKPTQNPGTSTIEAVFESWGKYAMWSDDTTEVALWDPTTKGFSQYYEVLRVADTYYYRTLTSLSRPILSHGIPEECPLQFTETVRQREAWLADVSKENEKSFIEGVKQSFGTPETPPAKP